MNMIYFNRGVAFSPRSLLQADGYLKAALNISLEDDGVQKLRQSFGNLSTAALGSAIHSAHRIGSYIIVGTADGKVYSIRCRTGASFTEVSSGHGSGYWRWRFYKNFVHGVNGSDGILFDGSGNAYPAKVSNPSGTIAGTAGAAGSPDGTYALYCTFLITFPNGQTYETGLAGDSDDVTVSSDKIEWSDIPTCDYEELCGDSPTIHRKLYRGPGTGGSLSGIYYIATITNNTDTTYSDNVADGDLSDESYVDDYTPGLDNPKFLEYHYGQLFYIHAGYLNRLYYSEVVSGLTGSENENLLPLAFIDTNWDDLNNAGFGKVDPQGLISWGTHLYIPLKHTWIRKQGNNSDNWSYKKTWASIGISAPESMAVCNSPTGILGISTYGKKNGIALFNGQESAIISSPILDEIFEDDLNKDAVHKVQGAYDGRNYHVLYPDGNNSLPNKHLVVDMSTYPELKAGFWDDLNSVVIAVHDQSSKVYVGTSEGHIKESGGKETLNIEIETKDLAGKNPTLIKKLKKLKYAINTGGDNVNLEIWTDGTRMQWEDGEYYQPISGNDDTIQYIDMPMSAECYKYTIKIVGSSLSTLEIYSPWEMET